MARDGIEPPTPAFSGPRSTTELPGLSADFCCIFCGNTGQKGPGIYFLVQRLATTESVYQESGQRPNRQLKLLISWIPQLFPPRPVPLLYTSADMKNQLLRTFGLACLAVAATVAVAQTAPLQPTAGAEARTVRAYEAARSQGPEALRAFLAAFPKGADLHVHLSGAVYAETFIREAAADGLCVDPEALKFVAPDAGGACGGNLVAATQLAGNMTSANQGLYDKLINSFSMRSFVPTPGWSGHDQFFATFGKFGGVNRSHTGEWVDEVAARAAAQNQQYIEIMQTPPAARVRQVASQVTWPATGAPDFAALRKKMLSLGLADDVAAGRQYAQELEASRTQMEHCGTSQAAPACQVTTRYIYQILRANAPETVFAQTLLGFETIAATLAAHEPGFIGINFVQPEDGYISMRDYTLQMHMLEYLHSVYPQVHITLHAGELAEGLVPPEGLGFHIRQAVTLGHAERIGHGVDVMHETDANALLKEMAANHVMVEINLSSNEGILGIKGMQHPFPLYRAAHVPVALSTDDEGVSRIDITHEYVRAAFDYHLSYAELKQLARTGMAHSFLSGADLWAQPDQFSKTAAACADAPGSAKLSTGCKAFLAASEKATAEWELESRFVAFQKAW